MKKFNSLAWHFFYLFVAVFAVIIVLFSAIFIYDLNPGLFNGKQIAGKEWRPRDLASALESRTMDEEVTYGYKLISETPKYLGPIAENPAMHFTGNNLSCTNCHLGAGTQPGAASWVGVTERFPQFGGRSNSVGTIEDRINGCMERSMNGKKMPQDSPPMKAIVAYMEWLGEGMPTDKEAEYKGFPEIKIPAEAVNQERGLEVYNRECMICHGEDGQGVRLADGKGYQYPPLWGPDSYNTGAGMHRVLTAAQFIKGNMPFGQATWKEPKLTDEEAYHVAGYINSFSRPEKINTIEDFPDRLLKPVSTPYGPWADSFSAQQHKNGPFLPIIEYYQKEHGITKKK